MATLTHRHIEVFRALMVTGSATRAAEMLYTSQPTISRELARMEQIVGFALFERAHGRLRPTMAALTLFDDVRLAYVGLERVAATAARLREFRDGQLSVIALPAFSHAILPGACRRFHAAHAGVSVSVATQESPVLEEWLTAQRYDLGLTEHDVAPAGTVLAPLFEADEVCVLPDGHPLLAKGTIELADLADRPFVNLSLNDPYRIMIDEAFAQLGVAPRSVVETPSAVSVCAFVRQGLGAAIVNPLTALDFAGRDLQIRPLARSFPYRVSVIVPEHRPKSLLVDAFTGALRDEADAIRGRLAAHLGRRAVV
ncbi:LysR family transcriptional regulator [Burkholderia ubonensis]|uniref:LysR family transcriptional regulator n=1 Tax=Burkholderia ubonensis TaxID=101571 RepID=UPI000753E210|nr:LysR family transcriptional regulator [Burkholderia ubonensis]KVZ76326.1 transcriptional regulator [Burkholderia ubonensis]KWE15798.1 transcriptional regulator [Burkholderia ubonensis]